MEIFPYQEWLLNGRAAAKQRGTPDFQTESISFKCVGINKVEVWYTVHLKSTMFVKQVDEMTEEKFFSLTLALIESSTQ